MVRMVVPGTVRHDDIGAPSANLADDLLTGIQGRSQLAVSIRENFSLGDPQAVSGFLGLLFADCGSRHRGKKMVTGVAVRDREKLDGMPTRGELRCRAPESDLAIIGMRADTNDPHL